MHDAIVVGARVAGAPTAMLLARKGYKVLLVDRDRFPSDIMSTHFIHLPGIARLENWGLLDKLVATGCPPITQAAMHAGQMVFNPPRLRTSCPASPKPPTAPAASSSARSLSTPHRCGRRVPRGVPVRGLAWDGDAVVGIKGSSGGKVAEERARIVIGADGLHSRVARETKPEEYDAIPSLTFAYYTYWSGPKLDGINFYFFEDFGILAFPTHWDQVCLGVGGEIANFLEFRKDIEGNYLKVIGRTPELFEQVRSGKQEQRFMGTADQPNYFRVPYGPGWALVGDAGYHRDFITGLGINDAFRDAELVAKAVDEGFSGARPLEEAMADYQATRDDLAKPLYDITTRMASGLVTDLAEFMKFGPAIARNLPSMMASTT
jgi:flavin-dependent dehydrogenase